MIPPWLDRTRHFHRCSKTSLSTSIKTSEPFYIHIKQISLGKGEINDTVNETGQKLFSSLLKNVWVSQALGIKTRHGDSLNRNKNMSFISISHYKT